MSGGDVDVDAIQQQASDLFDRLYDAFGRQHWPLGALNIATAAFMDMVFKSTLLELARSDGEAGLQEAKDVVLETLATLQREIRDATIVDLERARGLFEGMREGGR